MSKPVIFPLAFFLIIVTSCDEPTDGGPCEYETDTVIAKIIAVDSNGSDYPDIRIEFPIKPSGTDTMLYYTMNNESPSWKQCDLSGITVGQTLKVQRCTSQTGIAVRNCLASSSNEQNAYCHVAYCLLPYCHTALLPAV